MPKKTRGWPPERRKAQAARMKALKPWEKTTGPRTEEGKKAVRMNALKSGFRTAEMQALKKVLRAQKFYIKALNTNA